MAKIKYRSGDSFIELFDTATITSIQTRLSTVEGSLNRYRANSWLCEKRDDGFCTAVLTQYRTVNIAQTYTTGLFYGDFAAPAFPSGFFKEVYSVAIDIIYGNATVWCASASNSSATVSAPQTVRLISASSGSANVTLQYSALGRWR